MNLAALRLSIRYGGGDLQWFRRLPREDQALMLALHRLDAPAAPRSALEQLRAASDARDARANKGRK